LNEKALCGLAIPIDGRDHAVDLQNEIARRVNATEVEILLRG
jgi:hypothetical protein